MLSAFSVCQHDLHTRSLVAHPTKPVVFIGRVGGAGNRLLGFESALSANTKIPLSAWRREITVECILSDRQLTSEVRDGAFLAHPTAPKVSLGHAFMLAIASAADPSEHSSLVPSAIVAVQ